jgi:hypothetical protein
MASDADRSADPWTTNMPAALAGIVYRYDKATRRTMISNWVLIGSDAHQNYRKYLDHGLPWTRTQRARRVARQLIIG